MRHLPTQKTVIFTLLLLLLVSQPGWTQSAPFSRGVNLTNWFQAGAAEEIQLKRYNLEDFEQIKGLGCDVIRLPVNLIGMTSGAPNFTVDPLFYTFMDSVIYWAETVDMHLILDNHTFDPSENTSPDIDQFLYKVWPQIAYRYRDQHEKLYFEVLNEPHGISDALWNNIQQGVIDRIRQVDTNRWLVVGPAGWNSYHNLAAMPEYNDEKLIYTFHFYDPFLFTHQGASWTDPSMESLAGVPFPYNPTLMPDMPSEFAGTWIESTFNDYSNSGTETAVKSLIDIAVSFMNERNVPMFCGEFGVYHKNVDNETQRNNWYGIVREYLEAHDIAWTVWDYHGGFGIFEKNSDGLFNHDLNIPLLESLGLNLPDQSEYTRVPDSTSLVIYDDFIGKQVFSSNYSEYPVSYYTPTNPAEGNFFIQWENPSQYNHTGFDFIPNRDFSSLVENDYSLDCWLKGNLPSAWLDIRFIDSKTGVGNDHPWRMRYTLQPSNITWNGEWHKISIPLSDFEEHGSWDNNQWYDPVGAFDWSDVDRLEIVNEHGFSQAVTFCIDQLEIQGLPLQNERQPVQIEYLVFPNPASQYLTIIAPEQEKYEYEIISLSGKIVQIGKIKTNHNININLIDSGLYIINLFNGKNKHQAKYFMKL